MAASDDALTDDSANESSAAAPLGPDPAPHDAPEMDDAVPQNTLDLDISIPRAVRRLEPDNATGSAHEFHFNRNLSRKLAQWRAEKAESSRIALWRRDRDGMSATDYDRLGAAGMEGKTSSMLRAEAGSGRTHQNRHTGSPLERMGVVKNR